MIRTILHPLLALSVLTSMACGQAAVEAPKATPVDAAVGHVTEARVAELLKFLAADDLAGRDSPSEGLERAAEFLRGQFEGANLTPAGDDGSWFHSYELPGVRLDPAKLALTFVADDRTTVLAAVEDVRWWRGGAAVDGDVDVLRVALDDPTAARLGMLPRGAKPVVLEVAETSPLWRVAAASRVVLVPSRRGPPRGAAPAPWLLVRAGSIPSGVERLRLTIPAPEPTPAKLRNVVALLPGSGPGYVVLSAHYDHVGVGLPVDGDAIHNGADDNATGVTAVVAIAQALTKAKVTPKRGIVFVCFSAEEKGLLGSRAFAERPPFPLAEVAANVNLEMLGRPQPDERERAWVTGRDLSDFEARVRPGLEREGIAVVPFPMHAQLFTASDNASFVAKGVVAHSISAGHLHGDYHQPGDETDKIDVPHMTKVVRGLLRAVVDLADAETAPRWNEAGLRRIGQPR
jgi:aminopeptidase YwaD